MAILKKVWPRRRYMSDANNEWADMISAIKQDHEKTSFVRKTWTPDSKSEGTFPIRFLPPLKPLGERKFYFSHKVHWINGRPYECLDQNLVDSNGVEHTAQPCPACAISRKLYKAADENRQSDEWKTAGSLNGRVRYVYRVIVRGSQEETKPEFYESGVKIYDMLVHILTDSDYGIIVDPKKGRDFNIKKVGTGRNSNYDQSLPAANVSPIFDNKEELVKCLAYAKKMDYSSLVEFSTLEEMKAAIEELISPGSSIPIIKKPPIDNVNSNTNVPASTPPKVEEEKEPSDNSSSDDLDDILSEFGDM